MIRILSVSAPSNINLEDVRLWLEIGGRRLQWSVWETDRRMRHVIRDDYEGPPLLMGNCGVRRFIDTLIEEFGGERVAWENIGEVLRAIQSRCREHRLERKAAYEEGWNEALRVMAGAQAQLARYDSRRQRLGHRRNGHCRLYLMTDGEALKIGIARSPKNRARDLSGSREVRVLAHRAFGERADARAAEREAHRMFAAHRLRGEWFADVPEIRAYFGVAS